jgi:hypothetical protein
MTCAPCSVRWALSNGQLVNQMGPGRCRRTRRQRTRPEALQTHSPILGVVPIVPPASCRPWSSTATMGECACTSTEGDY